MRRVGSGSSWLIASADGMPEITELKLSAIGSKGRARKNGPTLPLAEHILTGGNGGESRRQLPQYSGLGLRTTVIAEAI